MSASEWGDPSRLFDVSGKIALVTGGSRGIGAWAGEALVRGGARVYIAARQAEACDATAARLSEWGDCISLPSDLSRMTDIEALAGTLAQRETRLDILINNAGTAWGEPLDRFSEGGWDKVMDLNLKSVFFLTQKLLPLLRAAGDIEQPSRIINIGSVDGLRVPRLDNFSYSAAKAGLHQLTRVLARRLAQDGIIVNAIAPGPFETRMMVGTLEQHLPALLQDIPRGRLGTPEDIMGAILFLCGRASAYITGGVIPVDGGVTTG